MPRQARYGELRESCELWDVLTVGNPSGSLSVYVSQDNYALLFAEHMANAILKKLSHKKTTWIFGCRKNTSIDEGILSYQQLPNMINVMALTESETTRHTSSNYLGLFSSTTPNSLFDNVVFESEMTQNVDNPQETDISFTLEGSTIDPKTKRKTAGRRTWTLNENNIATYKDSSFLELVACIVFGTRLSQHQLLTHCWRDQKMARRRARQVSLGELRLEAFDEMSKLHPNPFRLDKHAKPICFINEDIGEPRKVDVAGKNGGKKTRKRKAGSKKDEATIPTGSSSNLTTQSSSNSTVPITSGSTMSRSTRSRRTASRSTTTAESNDLSDLIEEESETERGGKRAAATRKGSKK